MRVQALFFMGLALAGFNVVAADAAAQYLDEENQQKIHHQNLNHISADNQLQVGEDNENPPQLLDTKYNLTEKSPKNRSRRQTPLLTGGCGLNYNISSGLIRHPLSGGDYGYNENCTWIVRTTERMFIKITKFHSERNYDYLYIRDGVTSDSGLLGTFTGRLYDYTTSSSSMVTETTSFNIVFTSDSRGSMSGFELHWEPAVETFYQVPIGSDYEVRLNFSVIPGPTALEWSYGSNFQDMPNIIQIPSDNGKFATSWIDLQDNNYQAILKCTEITQEDLETMFKLHVRNKIGETYYRVMLSAFPSTPPSSVQFSDLMPEVVRISWEYSPMAGNISAYVIQYKPRNATNQDYIETPHTQTVFYTIRGLTPSTQYVFRVLAVGQLGRGPPSADANVTTAETGCGGEYNMTIGSLRHPLSGGDYQSSEHCIWIIKTVERVTLVFTRFQTESVYDILHIRDGSSSESALLGSFSGSYTTESFPFYVTTSSTAAYLEFTTNQYDTDIGFELHWEPAVEKYYQVPIGIDYEVRLKFSLKPGPTGLNWLYGPSFQKMPNTLQIPSDNEKFTASLIDLKKNMYQAVLKIAGITEEDFDTKFMLHITNEVVEANYRVMLLASAPPPPWSPISDNITTTSVRITIEFHSFRPGDITSYVIQYKRRDADHLNYTQVTDLLNNQNTIKGLRSSTEYEFRVLVEHQFGRGPPSETAFITTRCGGEYNTTIGHISHPFRGVNRHHSKLRIWIIKTVERITLIFTRFQTERNSDILHVRDGSSSESTLLGSFSGSLTNGSFPSSVTTSSTAAHLVFTTDQFDYSTEFELHWEPAVGTFYQVPIGSDYEVRLNFSVNPGPTALEWSYGPNFQDMPNIIQIPADNEKFTTSWIDLQENNYQAILKFTGITQEDLDTMFMMHVTNGIGETYYRVMLSAFPLSSVKCPEQR